MGAVALGSICWPEVVLWYWFQWQCVAFLEMNVAPCVFGKNDLLDVRLQRCLPLPHDSCAPSKHLLARRRY